MGFDCTQATVSRDIADMGLRKLPEGIYVLAEDLHLQRMVSELVTGVLRTDNLVMIKAQPGTASSIAAAVDAAELPDVATTRSWSLRRRPRTANALRRSSTS